jgi:hypothetical protein
MRTFISRSRHSWLFGLSTGVLGIFFLLRPSIGFLDGGSNAWAQAGPGTPVSQQHLRELEERVKILELEHEALDRRTKLEAERTGRTIEELEMRIRTLENARAPEVAAVQPEKSATIDELCKDPYTHFPNGIRRVKRGCEDSTKPCDVPEVIDAQGMWKVRPECVPAAASQQGTCDTPYVIGPNGIKQFKPECLGL